MKCPQCGKETSGNFCSFCGASLGGAHCPRCGAEAEPGGRFCNACGAPLAVSAGAGGGRGSGVDGSRAAWAVAGVLMVALILSFAIPAIRSGGPETSPPRGAVAPTGGQVPPGAQATTDISNMTPREAADALYNRVMTLSSQGDTAQVTFFLPMAVAAYERARPLDADGLFHLALLQRMASDPAAALATAEEALAVHPNHLLNLAAAAGAAAEMGDTAQARAYYQRVIESWEEERAKDLEEYQLHGNMLPEIRLEAETFLEL